MKRIVTLALIVLCSAVAFTAQAQKRVPNPSKHFIRPSASRPAVSPYQGCRNYGKSIAVFGGSLSVYKESDTAKQLWADLLNAQVTSYGVPGAGFSKQGLLASATSRYGRSLRRLRALGIHQRLHRQQGVRLVDGLYAAGRF